MRAIAGAALLVAVYVTPEPTDTGYRMLLGVMVSFGLLLTFAGLFESEK